MTLVTFSVYGISIKHPEDWKIYMNPNNRFSKDSGFVKIDDLASSGQALSLSVRWEKCIAENIDMESYRINFCEGLAKKFKKKYTLYNTEIININGHQGCLIHFAYRANHQIYSFLGKEETVEQLQAAVYCDITQRMVVANISTTPENFAMKKDLLYQLVSNLTCHETIKG